MAVKPFNPNLLVLDDGSLTDTRGLPGLALKFLGQEQERQRQANMESEGREQDPYYGLWSSPASKFAASNPMPGWGGYFGLLQGKENAANAQGRNFKFDLNSWGNDKALDVPTGRTYFANAGEVAPGLRGRPNAALAGLQNASTTQNGYYTPDEIDQAGGNDALTESRRRAFAKLKGSY